MAMFWILVVLAMYSGKSSTLWASQVLTVVRQVKHWVGCLIYVMLLTVTEISVILCITTWSLSGLVLIRSLKTDIAVL